MVCRRVSLHVPEVGFAPLHTTQRGEAVRRPQRQWRRQRRREARRDVPEACLPGALCHRVVQARASLLRRLPHVSRRPDPTWRYSALLRPEEGRRLGRIELEYLRRALRVRPTGGGESAGVEEGVERRES
eukprot:scaffold15777_cov49-Phaeocystis_antarctica.AAC.2